MKLEIKYNIENNLTEEENKIIKERLNIRITSFYEDEMKRFSREKERDERQNKKIERMKKKVADELIRKEVMKKVEDDRKSDNLSITQNLTYDMNRYRNEYYEKNIKNVKDRCEICCTNHAKYTMKSHILSKRHIRNVLLKNKYLEKDSTTPQII